MYIITSTFEPDVALANLGEALALGGAPDQLAERLALPRDLEMIKGGIPPGSFKQVIAEVKKLRQYLDLDRQIGEVKEGKSMLRFLGSKFQEGQIAKLADEQSRFGSLLEGPRRFYKHPRVRLLSCLRDYALDSSQQGDATWTEVDEKTLVFPIVAMFETGDLAFAETLVGVLEKPLRDIDPSFLLEKFEGHRSISFDMTAGTAAYYSPAPGAPA